MKNQTVQNIGYYNANEYPISWVRPSKGQTPIDLEGGQPVTDAKGMLVEYHEELEEKVAQGLLSRATSAMPNFVNWNAIRERQLNKRPNSVAKEKPQGEKSGEPSVMKVASISSEHGVSETEVDRRKMDVSAIDIEKYPGVEVLAEGFYRYNNISFDSKLALQTFLAQENSND